MNIYLVEPIYTGFYANYYASKDAMQSACDAKYSLLTSQDVVDMSTDVLNAVLGRKGGESDWHANLKRLCTYILVYIGKSETYSKAESLYKLNRGDHMHIVINVYRVPHREGYLLSPDASYTDSDLPLGCKFIEEYAQTLIREDVSRLPELANVLIKDVFHELVNSDKYYFINVECET